MTNRKKLAIISTYDELCGIAGYTKALVPQLSNDFDVKVFDLDQMLFRSESKRVQKLADLEVRRICNELNKFDCVNIQLEHGTFGRSPINIYRRISKIIKAAPRICITFHTILPGEPFGLKDFLGSMITKGVPTAWRSYSAYKRNKLLDSGIYRAIYASQNVKPTSVIVHTRRDMRLLKLVHRIKNVFDHPLAFFSNEDAERVLETSSRSQFPKIRSLPKDAVLLGCFGFIGRYKGIDTAIKALQMLPPNFHLAIFGGVHPNEIKKHQTIDPFILELLSEIQPNKKWISTEKDVTATVNLSISAKEMIDLTTLKHPNDLSDRVHFMGALSDADFPKAMAICDTILLPYMEVGQSSSGPMSVAVDLRKHIIAARTKAFMQFSRYHSGRFSMFEVGNYLELAQLIAAESSRNIESFEAPGFNTLTNASIYRHALLLDEQTNETLLNIPHMVKGAVT